MEDLKYLREAMDLISFMAGTEDSELDPQDVEILAQEIEATNSTGYDDYDDDHKVEQPADGINIMKLIETSIARYISNIKDANNGVNPHYLSNNVLNYNDRMNSYDKASAIIMSTFSKNKNDVEQQLDTEILKEYNKITMLIKNKAKMKKLMGTKNDPFLFEGIMVTYDLMTRLLLAYVPMKIQSGETLASILNKKSGMVFMKIFDVVKYINSIQNKLGTKIYYKPPLVSEITGKKIDTVKDTKFDFRRNDQDREDSGFRDYNREVIVTAGRESEDIDYNDFEFEESMEGVFSWIKDKFKAERDRLANIKYRSQSIEITSKTQEKIILELQKINKLIYDKALKVFKQKYTAQNIEDFGLELWDPKTDTQCVHRASKWGGHIEVDTIQWATYNATYKNKDWYNPMYDDLSNIAKTDIPKSINVDGKEIEVLADVGEEYIMIETVKECKIIDNPTGAEESLDMFAKDIYTSGIEYDGTEGFFDGIKKLFSKNKSSNDPNKYDSVLTNSVKSSIEKCSIAANKKAKERGRKYHKAIDICLDLGIIQTVKRIDPRYMKTSPLGIFASIDINNIGYEQVEDGRWNIVYGESGFGTFESKERARYIMELACGTYAKFYFEEFMNEVKKCKNLSNIIFELDEGETETEGWYDKKESEYAGKSGDVHVFFIKISGVNSSEGTEGVLDSIKHYLWDTPKEAVLSTYSGIKFTKEDYEFLNKTLPSIMRDYVRQVNKSPLLKENGVKAELPDTMPIDVYKSWVSQPKLSRTMWIPIAKFTGLTSFKLKFKSLTAGGSWKMALERIPDRWKSRGSKLQEVSGGHLLLIESPGFRTKEVSVESFNFNTEMFYDSEDFIKNYHLSCESIENLIEIRNNNSLLEYSKLIKGLAFTTTLFKPLTGYDVEELTKDIDKLLKDPSVNVVNMITALIAKIDVKVITPINIEFKRYTNNEEGKSLLSEQFAPKEFDSSIQGRMYQASKPKVEDFEEF